MMAEYEFIFGSTLRNKVAEKIVGGVKTWVTNDELHVSIRVEECCIKFEYVISNFSDKILHNFTTDYAAYEVINAYKAYINNRFFK